MKVGTAGVSCQRQCVDWVRSPLWSRRWRVGSRQRRISIRVNRARSCSRPTASNAITAPRVSHAVASAGRCRPSCRSTTRPAPPRCRCSPLIFSRSTPIDPIRALPFTTDERLTIAHGRSPSRRRCRHSRWRAIRGPSRPARAARRPRPHVRRSQCQCAEHLFPCWSAVYPSGRIRLSSGAIADGVRHRHERSVLVLICWWARRNASGDELGLLVGILCVILRFEIVVIEVHRLFGVVCALVEQRG